MMNNKFIISSNFSDEILIDWYPSLFCNFKCSYCFVHKFKDYAFNENHFKIFKKFLNINSIKYNKKIKLRILGGEPSLIPNFNDYIKELNKNIQIELVTNGTGNINDLTRVNSIEYSIHLEYYNKFKEKFKENLINQKKKTIVINVHNSYKNNLKLLNEYKTIIDDLKKYSNENNLKLKFSINPLILEDKENSTIDFDFFKEFFNIENYLEDEHNSTYTVKNMYADNEVQITYSNYLEIYSQFNNNFKNNVCYNNYFIVDYYYDFRYNCNGEKIFNILSNPFNEIIIKSIKCKNEYCDEGCFMDCKKIIKI